MSHPSSPKKRVLLIGWDSADWKIIDKLLEEGGMDGIRSLMNGGNHGNLATGWTPKPVYNWVRNLDKFPNSKRHDEAR